MYLKLVEWNIFSDEKFDNFSSDSSCGTRLTNGNSTEFSRKFEAELRIWDVIHFYCLVFISIVMMIVSAINMLSGCDCDKHFMVIYFPNDSLLDFEQNCYFVL